jgi:hypothetical protein
MSLALLVQDSGEDNLIES